MVHRLGFYFNTTTDTKISVGGCAGSVHVLVSFMTSVIDHKQTFFFLGGTCSSWNEWNKHNLT